jgi:hypothetical protein
MIFYYNGMFVEVDLVMAVVALFVFITLIRK